MRGWTGGVGLSPYRPLLPPSRPLSPSSLFGAACASRAQIFPLLPSLSLFFSPLPPPSPLLPPPSPSSPSFRTFTSPLPPPQLPPPSYPVRTLIYAQSYIHGMNINRCFVSLGLTLYNYTANVLHDMTRGKSAFDSGIRGLQIFEFFFIWRTCIRYRVRNLCPCYRSKRKESN